MLDHAGRKQVELDAAGGVAGVRTAVDLEHNGDGGAGAAKFIGDLIAAGGHALPSMDDT